MNINELTCGLDFGTSNSIISLTDKATRKEVFSYSESSILYFPDTNEMKYMWVKRPRINILKKR